MDKKFLGRVLALCLAAATLTSCFDNTLDFLNKEISTEVAVGNEGFTIPVGSFVPITLSDYLKDIEGLTVENGLYTLSQSDTLTQEVSQLAGGEAGIVISKINSKRAFSSNIQTEQAQAFAIVDTPIEFTAPISAGSAQLNIKETLSSSINKIYTGYLKEPSDITITVTLDNIVESMGDICFDDFEVVFPDYLVFAEPSSSNSNAALNGGNTLTLNKENSVFSVNGEVRSYSATFEIVALDFTDPQYEGAIGDNPEMTSDDDARLLSLSQSVNYSGGLSITSDAVTILTQPMIVGAFEFTLNELNITQVDVDLDLTMELPAVSFEIADLGEGLGDDFDLSIKLADPKIEMNIKNPLGLGIVVKNFSITTDQSDVIEVADFTIPAKRDTDPLYSDYKVSISTTGAAEGEGVIGAAAPDLGKLFENGVPGEIELLLEAGSEPLTEGDFYHIDISNAYDLEFEYSVIIPLAVEWMEIGTTREFSGINKSLSTLSDYVSSFKFSIEAQNTIPVTLTLSDVKTYDTEGEELIFNNILGAEGKASILAGEPTADGTTIATKSTIALDMSQGEEDALSRLDKIKVQITVTADGEHTAELREEQYMELDLMLELPEGITMDVKL